MSKFIPSRNGNTESLISVNIIEENFSKIEVGVFIKNYKISNFFKGKFYLIRLIKKIFKYKLNERLVWNPDFWNNVSIVKVDALISISNKNYNKFEKSLKIKYSNRRLRTIYKYKTLVEQNEHLGYPLYITGDCLNYVGAKVIENELFMLDGSRRLLSLLLAKKESTKLLIIKLKNN